MENATIVFFSSDARELYKADIYRAMALPAGYILHFRYPTQYIDRSLLANLKELLDQPGTIFYVSGNDTSLPEKDRQVKLFSIRSVVVRGIMVDQNIDTIHFYLELGDFADVTPHEQTPPEARPPYIFVSKILLTAGTKGTWKERAEAIQADFKPLPFFLIKSVSQRSRALSPVYSWDDKSCSFHLSDESEYQVELTFYDPWLGATGVTVENGSSDVGLLVPAAHRIGAESDTQVFKLQTRSISSQKLSTYSRLLGVDYIADAQATRKTDFRVSLEWTVIKRWTRIWQFGLLSILAAIGLGLAKLATDNLQTDKLVFANLWLGVGGLLAIGVAASLLYLVFNKT